MSRAIYFTGKERAELVPADLPVKPAPGHLLGKSLFSLISPGTELHSGFLKEHGEPESTGYATVFEVEQVGEGISSVSVGDRFLCMHPHKSIQHVALNDAIPLPPGLDPAAATIGRLLNIGMTTLMTTKARPGERVLVTGAGPIGFLSALLFHRCGYKVMLCDPEESRLRNAKLAGIPLVANALPTDDPAWKGNVALVVECSGHESAAIDGCQMIRKGGEIVLAGVPWKRQTERFAQGLLSAVFFRYAVLRSGWEWELPVFTEDFRPNSVHSNIRTALQWLAEGLFETGQHLRKVSPEQAQAVYEGLAGRRFQELFVVFDWSLLMEE